MKKIILFLAIFLFGFDSLSTKQKGVLGEQSLINYLKKGGWQCVNGEWNGVNGIDALCFKKDKNGKIKDVLIGESKFNKSKLNCKLNNGMCQMSKEWILDRLKKLSTNCAYKKDLRCPTQDELKEIIKKVKKSDYKARLFKLTPVNNGLKVEMFKLPAGADSKTISKKNSFQKINNTLFSKQGDIVNLNKPKTQIDKDTIAIMKKENIKPSNTKFFKKVSTVSKTAAGVGVLGTILANSKNILKSAPLVLGPIGAVLGVVAQVGWDIYVGNKLDDLNNRVSQNTQAIEENRELINQNTQAISINAKNIAQNRAYIERIIAEQNILKQNVANNTHKINQLYTYAFVMSNDINELKSNLKNITKTFSNAIESNKKEIDRIKESIFKTGIEMWQKYQITKDEKYLVSAIDDFTKSIKNGNSYAYFYLSVCYAKKFLNSKNEIEKIEAVDNFKSFAKYSDNLEYIFANAFILKSIGVDDKSLVDIIKDKAKLKIQNAILNNNFDSAVDIGGVYYTLSNDKTLLDFALHKREENYEKNRNFKGRKDVFVKLQKYKNSLLNKEAVRFLYNNNYYDDTLKVLKNYRIEDDEFILKAYLAIFKMKGDKEKLYKLKRLILENPTYSKKLKDFAKNI